MVDDKKGRYGEKGAVSEFGHRDGNDEAHFSSWGDWQHFNVVNGEFCLICTAVLNGVAMCIGGVDCET